MHTPLQPRLKTSARFCSLMELYEQNYLQLRLLLPSLRSGECYSLVSCVPGCLDLYMQLTEQSRYTSTLRLTYRFVAGGRASLEPDLYIRIYHDARTAEVMSGLLNGKRYGQRQSRSLVGSWEPNRFLYKWLRYLLHRGHRFDADRRESDWSSTLASNADASVPLSCDTEPKALSSYTRG